MGALPRLGVEPVAGNPVTTDDARALADWVDGEAERNPWPRQIEAATVLRAQADEIDRLRAQVDSDGDLLMTAWGLLANVSEGNWERQTDEWQDAVKRWRTRFHERLDVVKVGEPEEES